MKISIFTPTYNRGHLIKNVYNSLCRQNYADFEWIVIDDGGSDNTEEIVAGFIAENKIKIIYLYQKNGGKHRAINKAVKLARGELFFIVDSDDYLSDCALQLIAENYSEIKNDDFFCGVCGLRADKKGIKIGGEENWKLLDCNSVDFRYKFKGHGDMAEVVKTSVIRSYPFPEIEGENFCPESLVWNRIAKKYKFRYFYEKIYICEYLTDGLTAKITRLRMQSPEASLIYYAELSKMQLPFIQQVKAQINFWRFAFCSKQSFFDKIRQMNAHSLVLLPISLLYHIFDNFTNKQ